MIHIRFSQSGVFAKRKDVPKDSPRELIFAIPDECKFHATYETLRVDEAILAGWDQNRGAWYVPVMDDKDEGTIPALTLDDDLSDRELPFSDMEVYVK